MNGFLARFAQDESAVTAMEYGMIASLVAIAIIVVLGRVGTALHTTFDTIATHLEDANKTK